MAVILTRILYRSNRDRPVTSSSTTTPRFPVDRLIISACLVAVIGLAWLYLLRLDARMSSPMAGMMMSMSPGIPWTLGDFLLAFAMWGVMMAGMMVPAAMPVVFIYAKVYAGRARSSSSGPALMFALGHIAVWIVFSGIATLVQGALYQSALMSPEMAVTSSRISGVVLIAAGIYQLTPAKAACLTKCQSPIDFLITNWRDGNHGALTLGLRYGLYCVGCCWALMLVLFVVGVMNLAWVAVLTVFLLVEKLSTSGLQLARATGVAMVLAGVVTLVR